MMGYRRAAATLHGLSGEDREWILSELPHEDGQRVKQCLDELNELGFAEGLQSGDVRNFFRRPAHATNDRASAVLRKAAAAEVYSVVEAEPALLVGRLLSIRDWPWGDEMLKMFPPMKQEHIRSAMTRGSPAAPALDKFLIERLAMRLNGDGGNARQFPRGRLARFSTSLSRMVRSWNQ